MTQHFLQLGYDMSVISNLASVENVVVVCCCFFLFSLAQEFFCYFCFCCFVCFFIQFIKQSHLSVLSLLSILLLAVVLVLNLNYSTYLRLQQQGQEEEFYYMYYCCMVFYTISTFSHVQHLLYMMIFLHTPQVMASITSVVYW